MTMTDISLLARIETAAAIFLTSFTSMTDISLLARIETDSLVFILVSHSVTRHKPLGEDRNPIGHAKAVAGEDGRLHAVRDNGDSSLGFELYGGISILHRRSHRTRTDRGKNDNGCRCRRPPGSANTPALARVSSDRGSRAWSTIGRMS